MLIWIYKQDRNFIYNTYLKSWEGGGILYLFLLWGKVLLTIYVYLIYIYYIVCMEKSEA